jgi:D-alanine-D-alanine ligase-like ATP-grasp enzyme
MCDRRMIQASGMLPSRPESGHLQALRLQALRYYYKSRALLSLNSAKVRAMRAHRHRFYQQVWQDAVALTGATVIDLGDGFLEVDNGVNRVRVSGDISPLDNAATLRLAENKAVIYRMLSAMGVPVPTHQVVALDDTDRTVELLRTLNGPLVAKPADQTGAGSGVSTNIKTVRQMVHALAWARAFCPRIIIEKQIPGDNYRLLYLDGHLLDCIIRRPPVVIGNGRATIRQLVHHENEMRLNCGTALSQVLLSVDQDMLNTLAIQGLTLHSRPAEGRTVPLKHVINENRGDDNETALGSLCPAVIDMGRAIAERVGLRAVGIDLITRDPGRPLAETGGAVIDVNAPPGFYYHYHKKDGSFPVALHILRRALETPPRVC